MPEFILEHGSVKASAAFNALDEFTQGYITAAFFTETGSLDDGELYDATLADLSPEAFAQMVADCKRFRASLKQDHLGRDAVDMAVDYAAKPYNYLQAGHDLWYTRNGHGCGYWDRDLPKAQADALDAAAKALGECDMYRGNDEKIYLS